MLTVCSLLQISQIIWMLKHRLLLQLHCYVYLVANPKSPPFINVSYNTARTITSIEPSSIMGDVELALRSIISPSTSDTARSDGSGPRKTPSPIEESAIEHLSHLNLTQVEVENILRVPAAKNLDDLKLFARLCPYFDGRRHLEDIMYYENVRRPQLLELIEKFHDVLLTVVHEDAAVAQLLPYTPIN